MVVILDYGSAVQRLNVLSKKVGFDEDSHTYNYKGRALCSCTSVISRWFPEFDSRGISENKAVKELGGSATREQVMYKARSIRESWKAKARVGTDIHSFAERLIYNHNDFHRPNDKMYFFGNDIKIYNSGCYKSVVKFVEDNEFIIRSVISTEQTVFSNKFCVAGQIDFITINTDGSLDLWDWKSTTDIPRKDVTYGKFGFGILAKVPSTSYWKYSLQLSIYRYLLEKEGFKINNSHLVWLGEDGNYEIIDTIYMADEIRVMLEKNIE
jgi:hypothetical protein